MDIKNKKIVAITGCAAGIAHTFMAAEGIETSAKELGAIAKVETHGTAGPDNVLTAKDIREADLVLIAADIAVDKKRFVGKLLYETDTHLAIADPKKLVAEAFEKATKYKQALQSGEGGSNTESLGDMPKEGKVLKHIMFALSWMIPLIIAGGLTMAVGNVFAMQPGWVQVSGMTWQGVFDGDTIGLASQANGIYLLQDTVNSMNLQNYIDEGIWWRIPDLTNIVYVVNDGTVFTGPEWIVGNGAIFEWGKVWSFYGRDFFNVLFSGGAAALKLIYPIIAAGIAYSIAGKLSFAPAFLGGWLMNDGDFLNLQLDGSPFGTGFLGAIVIGFFVGYLTLAFRKIKVNRTFKGICDLMLWPFLMILIVVITGRYVFGPVLGVIAIGLYNGIIAIGNIPGGNILLAAVVAGMICTDLGGPINKTALVAGTAIFLSSQSASINPNDWNFVPGTATQAAISIPPLIAFFSVMLFGKYFTSQERTLGTNASFMGLVGISEGAIPFAIARPKVFIPANIVGGMISGMMVTICGFQFYGGLGSPLAPFLGYVPSTVFHNYLFGSLMWILCYGLGVAAGLAIVFLMLTITFKSQKANRLAGEVKAESKEQIRALKLQNKETADVKVISKNNVEIEKIKSQVKDEIPSLKEKVKAENAKALEEAKGLIAKENERWESELQLLNGNIESAKNSSTYESDLLIHKEAANKLNEELKAAILKIKEDLKLTKEDKKFKINLLKEEKAKDLKELESKNDYLFAQNEFKDAKKAHKANLQEINSEYVKKVS